MRSHPIHAALSDFPVVFICCAPACDLMGWTLAAHYLAIAAVIAAVPTAASGAWELAKLPRAHPATNLALWHASFMGSAVITECIAMAVRHSNQMATLVLEIAAALLVVGGGWFGGHLVFVHGVGRAPTAKP